MNVKSIWPFLGNDNREGKSPLYYFAFADGSFIDFRVIRKEIIRAERMIKAINT